MIENLTEKVVAHEYERLLPEFPAAKHSDAFRADVMTYALNRLPPRYVSRHTGRAVSTLNLNSDQEMARVAVVVMEAFKVVLAGDLDKATPRPR